MSVEAAQRLVRVADALDAGRAPAAEDAAAHAAGLRAFVDGDVDDLGEALGFAPPAPGCRSWRTEAAIIRRDQLLRQAASDFFAEVPVAEQARRLAERWTRYAAGGWPRERVLPALPAHRDGTIEARLWAVMRVRDDVLSARRLRFVLAASCPYSRPDAPATLDETEVPR